MGKVLTWAKRVAECAHVPSKLVDGDSQVCLRCGGISWRGGRWDLPAAVASLLAAVDEARRNGERMREVNVHVSADGERAWTDGRGTFVASRDPLAQPAAGTGSGDTFGTIVDRIAAGIATPADRAASTLANEPPDVHDEDEDDDYEHDGDCACDECFPRGDVVELAPDVAALLELCRCGHDRGDHLADGPRACTEETHALVARMPFVFNEDGSAQSARPVVNPCVCKGFEAAPRSLEMVPGPMRMLTADEVQRFGQPQFKWPDGLTARWIDATANDGKDGER